MPFGTPVQTLKVEAASGTSWSAAFASNVASGDLLTCVGCGYQGTPANFTVSDTNNGTGVWTQRAVTAAQATVPSAGAYCKNASGGTTPSVTFNAGTGASGGTAFAQEWSGADTAAPFTAGEAASGAGTISGAHSIGPITNSVANAIYVGGFWADEASSRAANATTWGNSWTQDAEEPNGSTNVYGSVGHLAVTTSASRSQSVTFTNTSGTAAWSALFMVFGQAAAGGAGPFPLPRRNNRMHLRRR